MTARLKNNPSVTKFTDMNEYTNASNFDQPLTRPVALRRKSVGDSLTVAIDLHVGIQRRSLVDSGAERRRVEVEDRSTGVGDLFEDRVDALSQLVVGELAERVPRRGVGPAERHHREPLQLQGLLAAHLDDV